MALEAILASKRVELADRMARRPLPTVIDGLEPSDRDFEAALRRRRPAFILEIKPASPSEGQIRDVTTLGPAIASYGRHADAISVLTDQAHFGGSFELLARVRRATTQPILCKDFVLGPYQVYEARRAGADAVLLMLSVLDDEAYRACASTAARLRMGVLTEAHDEPEVRRAVALGATVIGLNNRNLRTLAVDVDLAPVLARLIPPDRIAIAESGVRSRGDVNRLTPAVDGFLVGTALMRASDVDRAARRLIHGATKVCGLTRGEDALTSAAAGATHGGLIFAPASPRAITRATAEGLVGAAPLDWVGVFVDEEPGTVAELATTLGLAAVQLHGDESEQQLGSLRRRLPPTVEIWKAIRVGDRSPDVSPGRLADRVLFDTARTDRRGGTGAAFDWSLVARLPGADRAILSGGLGPGNLALAMATGFDFFDVNSGVEDRPGIKSAAALRHLFDVRRTAIGESRGSP